MKKLENYIESKKGKKFIWGKNDCYTFVRDWLIERYSKPFIQLEYHSKREALLKARSHRWIQELKNYNFVFEKISLDKIENGDIIILKNSDFECVHLVLDNRVYSHDENAGLINFDKKLFENFDRMKVKAIRIYT